MELEESEGFSDILKSKSYTVVLIGAANVGKTALVYRYVLNELPPGLTSTIGVEFTKRVVTDKLTGQRVQLHIWDTAGQERFKSVTKHYYRGADACLLVFDMSSQESFEEVPTWLTEVKENTPPECAICLLANKSDLIKLGEREISREEALKFATENKLSYFETSAYWERDESPIDSIEGGIDYVFDSIMKTALTRVDTKEESLKKNEENVRLDLQELYTYHGETRCPSCWTV